MSIVAPLMDAVKARLLAVGSPAAGRRVERRWYPDYSLKEIATAGANGIVCVTYSTWDEQPASKTQTLVTHTVLVTVLQAILVKDANGASVDTFVAYVEALRDWLARQDVYSPAIWTATGSIDPVVDPYYLAQGVARGVINLQFETRNNP